MHDRRVILYISMSLDGFIATNDDDISWLSIAEHPGEDYGYADFSRDIDTYIVGRKTYDKVVSLVGRFPYEGQYDCYVITRQNLPSRPGVTFYNGDVSQLIRKIRQKSGKHIYCDGGGEIVRLFMQHDLIDDYIISIIPTFLGDGKRLFLGGVPGRELHLDRAESYASGLVQMRYSRVRK
ncbi:MAG: dihydrofolate reductase family protein [Bacteroidota bacterium]